MNSTFPKSELAEVRITHGRPGPMRNAFAYRALYVILPLSTLGREPLLLFSFERFNLFSFFARDHGDGRTHLETWAREVLTRRGITEADGEIVLVTLPRVLGYVFNPVSFWLCHDSAGGLRAVIAEVNNTFAERHVYVCCHDDRRPIDSADWLIEGKAFHVSPFLETEGEYKFRFAFEGDALSIRIDHYGNDGLRLATGMAGRREPLTSMRLLSTFARNPLLPMKVIGLIHWQAAKLVMKGLRWIPHRRRAGDPV
jgi:DUF1365 family protein